MLLNPAMAQETSQITTDHDTIRKWAETRGGKPACVKGTGGGGDRGMIRLMFPDAPNHDDSDLEPISWEQWFEKFEDKKLALVYEDETSGNKRNFNKLVSRENA